MRDLDVLDIVAQGDARALIVIHSGDIRGPSFKKDVVVLVLAVREFGRFKTPAGSHGLVMDFAVNRGA
jgi:hypothetical protein